jgi:hypothetical protein
VLGKDMIFFFFSISGYDSRSDFFLKEDFEDDGEEKGKR